MQYAPTETARTWKYDADIHHRRSIRLRGYDYSQIGVYFVTICTQHKSCLFGNIADDAMILNEMGCAVADEWQKTPRMRPNIELDELAVMPNHVHGIIVIMEPCEAISHGDEGCEGVLQYAPTSSRSAASGSPRSPSQTIGAVIRGFKAAATRRINMMRSTPGNKLWQRNYYEHIVRDEGELNKRREYIITNPRGWALDRNNPNWRG